MPSPDFSGWNLPHEPHPYQREAFASFFAEHDGEGRSQLIVMATGLGKSVTACLIAREILNRGGKVLVLAHLDNLIGQLADEFAYWGLPTAVEKAESRARDLAAIGAESARCVVASVATLRGPRLASWPPGYFDLIIVDECHRSTSGGYRAIFAHFARARLLGFTATPNRTDEVSLGEVFARVAYEYLLPDAIRSGDLCRLAMREIECGVDLRDIKVIGRRGAGADYDPDAVGDLIGPHVADMAKAVILGDHRGPHLGPGQTLIFAPCRLSAQAFADAFTQLGVPAGAVCYKTPDRARRIEQFKEGSMIRPGRYAALANYGLLTTGFNHRPIGNIVLARPTQSALLLEQMLGRGTRTCEGKSECRVIEFGWIVDPDKIARPVDLFLAPGASPAAREAARAEAKATPDPAEAARKAEEAEARKAAREEAARRADKPVRVRVGAAEKVKHRARSFDLFAVKAVSGVRMPVAREGVVAMPANAATTAKLRELGLDSAEGVSQREADLLLAHWSERAEAGMASLKQVRYLVRQGHPAEAAAAMTKAEAMAIIGPMMQRFRGRQG